MKDDLPKVPPAPKDVVPPVAKQEDKTMVKPTSNSGKAHDKLLRENGFE